MRVIGSLVVSLLVSLAAVPAVPSATSAGGASSPRWSLQSSHVTANLLDVSCSTPLQCMAVGARSVVLTTLDGGRTWKRSRTAYGTAVFTAVRCPAPGVCTILDPPDTILRTTDGGRSWGEITVPLTSQYRGLSKLACPTRLVCYVTASPSGDPLSWYTHSVAIFKTSTGGNFWQQESIPSRVTCNGSCGSRGVIGYDLQWISCQSAQHCRAGGNTFIGSHEGWASGVLRTDNGGANWGLANSNSAPDIATCPTTSVCTGIYYQPTTPNTGPYLERSTNAGAGWVIKPIPAAFAAISCSGPSFCVLVGPKGTVAAATTTHMSAQPSPTTRDLSAVACPRQNACYAVGANGTIVARKG
jgi:photosystem II stability/assembly factor-like uncharacterized protein